MKTITKKLSIAAILLFSVVASQQIKAQGNVISVTPDSTELGSTVTLTITGHNTLFSQATTSLHKTSPFSLTLWASTMNIINDSTMQATFIVPGTPMYIGYYDVMGGFASPLVNGFRVTSGVVIQGNVFYDGNGNCTKDGGEYSRPYHSLLVQPGNTIVPVDYNGNYTAYVPTGFYTATLSLMGVGPYEAIQCFSSGIDSIPIASATSTTMMNQNVPVTWTDTCSRIRTWICTNAMRPCFNHGTNIIVQNQNPIPDNNVTVKVTMDNNLVPYSSYPAWTSLVGNVLTFNIGSIPAFGTYYISIYDNIACNAVLGTSACISALAIPNYASCVDSSINYSHTCRNFSASYDPNEKVTVSPSTTDITAADELTYMIRFQNSGNDTAFNIVVLDTISNYLDPYSLIPAPSDHPYTYQLIGSNVAKFTFNNIMLPDSTTSEPNSHGFITYSIHQNPNNQPGTQIFNTGNIYFDFNSNVRTNTTFNQIPSLSVGVSENVITKDGISIYPNPFTNATKFVFANKTPNSKYSIQLFDVTGKKVKEVQNITDSYYDLNRGDLKAQLYFYKVFDNESQVGVGKLIIME